MEQETDTSPDSERAADWHIPVLLEPILEHARQVCEQKSAPLLVDGTLGDGGHCLALLRALPGARYIGFDQDAHMLERAGRRLMAAGLVQSLRENPMSRRHILNAWNVGELDRMALPPCHCLAQWYVSKDGGLSCQLYQRSVDVFLGLPFNIASYSLLTMMLAQVTGLKAREFIFTGGDVHLYQNHFDQVRTQLEREPYDFPRVQLNPEVRNIDDFKFEDIQLIDYRCHPRIAAPIAV